MDINNNNDFFNYQANELENYISKNIPEIARSEILAGINMLKFGYYNQMKLLKEKLNFYEIQLNSTDIRREYEIKNLEEKNSTLEKTVKKHQEIIQSQKKTISQIETDLNEYKQKLMEYEVQTIQNNQIVNELKNKINELDLSYSKYYTIENQNKEILDILLDARQNDYEEKQQENLDENDPEWLKRKYSSSLMIFRTMQKKMREATNEFNNKQLEFQKENENLNTRVKELELKIEQIQKEKWDLCADLKSTNEYYQMASDQLEKYQESLEGFKYALTDEYKRSMKEFYKELNTCIESLIKIVRYSQDVFNKKSKSMVDVSSLDMPILFDEKNWNPNLIFKKDFWPAETKKIRDLKATYIDFKVKYNLIALTDLD
ncbi:unnamed protein product [Brachionus calyciflorus]|uniref:Uncharacterized protein n=1 Tax=Brachionus calyciflorus TaxID=104777 RepID=A0A813YFS5_9BILA|nr:unnamed protein product [Brachionus calyciflorus]